MDETKRGPESAAEQRPQSQRREERLAAALRDNLRKRKAQAQARRSKDEESADPEAGNIFRHRD